MEGFNPYLLSGRDAQPDLADYNKGTLEVVERLKAVPFRRARWSVRQTHRLTIERSAKGAVYLSPPFQRRGSVGENG